MAIQKDLLSDPEIRTRLRNCVEHGRHSVLKVKRMFKITHTCQYWIDKPTNTLGRQIQGNIGNTYSVF